VDEFTIATGPSALAAIETLLCGLQKPILGCILASEMLDPLLPENQPTAHPIILVST
jgi:hypothetical protein